MPLPALLAGLIPDLAKKAVDMIDRKITTKDERAAAEREYQLELEDRIRGAWDSEQAQLTERHRSDMSSDSWLSKNIRPLALIYLMVLFTMAFFKEVPETVLEMLRDLLLTAFVFYFGSRTMEKIANIVKR
jgi:hypothetical protein